MSEKTFKKEVVMGKLWLRNALILVTFLLFASGCATVSTTGMLEYDPGQKDTRIDDVKFSLLVYEENRGARNITEEARKYYPSLFNDDFTSLPVWFELRCYSDRISHDEGALIFALSLTLIPGPEHDEIKGCTGRLKVHGIDGYIINKEVGYRFEKSYVVPGPLYWPFVPLVHSRKQFEPLQEQTRVEYAVRALKEADPAKLKDMYNYRKKRLQKVSIYGEPYWVFVGLDQSEKARQEGKGRQDRAIVRFWKDYPKPLDRPLDSIVGAVYENDSWQPVMSIPRRLSLKKLTMVSVKLEDGKPAGIEVKEDIKPRIEYFMYLSNPNDAEELRWSNNMLVDAKNITFPEDLKQKDKDSLIQLQTQLEKEILRLNENLSKLELSLQQKLVKNEDVRFENSLIPLYQQRISIFEALITSLKQALRFK